MEELEKLKLARLTVAPVWGRGLKYQCQVIHLDHIRRPRMGAWIEIAASR